MEVSSCQVLPSGLGWHPYDTFHARLCAGSVGRKENMLRPWAFDIRSYCILAEDQPPFVLRYEEPFLGDFSSVMIKLNGRCLARPQAGFSNDSRNVLCHKNLTVWNTPSGCKMSSRMFERRTTLFWRWAGRSLRSPQRHLSYVHTGTLGGRLLVVGVSPLSRRSGSATPKLICTPGLQAAYPVMTFFKSSREILMTTCTQLIYL